MQINLDFQSFKKTYAAGLAGIISLVLGQFGVVNDALSWRIAEGLILAAVIFDRMGTAKVDNKLDLVSEILGQITGPLDPEKK